MGEQVTASQASAPAPVLPSPDVPRGGLGKNYGSLIGIGGAGLALLEMFRSDPKDGIGLFAQFGPKYLLWGFIAYIIWDLGKRGLKVGNKAADNLGLMAKNTGDVAIAMNAVAHKSDDLAVEMRMTSAYAAQKANRSVELAEENSSKLDRLLAKHGVTDGA